MIWGGARFEVPLFPPKEAINEDCLQSFQSSAPLGAVKPGGWLRSTLKAQAAGLTGLLDTVPPRRGGFRANPVTEKSIWRGGNTGRDLPGMVMRSERAPYYIRGLVALAYVLNDPALIGKA